MAITRDVAPGPRVDLVERGATARDSDVPLWTYLVFVVAMVAAYVGTTFGVYGVHGDYDTFLGRSTASPFWFVEEWQLLSVARPVAVWVSNIPLYPMTGIADFPWARAFGIGTLCLIGLQMIAICVRYLRIRPFDALALAVVTFAVPAFSDSIMNIAAWGPYQTTVCFAFIAYAFLSRTNGQAMLFRVYATLAQYRSFGGHLSRYIARWPFVLACFFFQVALYDYPSNALVICLFPVIGLLFSGDRFPRRALVACRDIVFIGANLAFYFLATKLIYFPILRATYPVRVFPTTGFTSYYRFELQHDPLALLSRLGELLRVAGNLWFLPQSNAFAVVGLMLAATLWMANTAVSDRTGGLTRLRFGSLRSEATLVVIVAVICYLVSAAPILLSIGGFVDYRTIAPPTALTGVVAVYALAGIVEVTERRFRLFDRMRWSRSQIAVAALLLSAIGTTAYHVHLTVRLALNEFAYIESLIRNAVEDGAKSLVILDWRPFFPPNDLRVAYDLRHRAVPPYEMGCFSSYCFSQAAIYGYARQRLGYADERIDINIFRGDDARGLTCTLFTGHDAKIPAGLSDETKAKIAAIRKHGPVACVPFQPAWRDVDLPPETWDHTRRN
ncbi:MAG TPA: hypothetical protein VNF99_17055 [Stellaceae bacterium]|nr:hypothetical protein [Stellaceae bacterium]